MKDQFTIAENPSETVQVIQQAINAWVTQNKAVTAFFNKYDESVYNETVAPSRNRAIYLLGHLAATNDSLLPLLGLGEKMFPELEAFFIKNPDGTFVEIPKLGTLRQNWETVNIRLEAYFRSMTPAEWLERHARVSAEDFEADRFRNKLNVLMSRTSHASYHLGQLAFLVTKI